MTLRAGFETTHPETGIRTILIAGAAETQGRGWTIEVHTPEGAASILPEHFHLTWTETFEVLQGDARCSVDGLEQALHAGESTVMPPGVRHVHPWNTGDGVMVYRQTNDFGGVDPAAVDDVIGVAATLNGLAREGKLGRNGLPKNPLQFAATLRALTRHGGFDAKAPVALQRGISATLGWLAESLGYRGADPRYFRATGEGR
jgi:quercetin dioxygenase-like cupin family protein